MPLVESFFYSIYFTAGSRVRCISKAHTSSGYSGLESISEWTTVSTKEGICRMRLNKNKKDLQYSAQVCISSYQNQIK